MIIDGTAPNLSPCKCGDVACGEESGLICYAALGTGYCRKSNPGKFGVFQGDCSSVAGASEMVGKVVLDSESSTCTIARNILNI